MSSLPTRRTKFGCRRWPVKDGTSSRAKRIYKRTDQRKILRDARLVCFVLPKTFASHGFWEQAKYIVSYWPKIRDVAATEAEPGQFWLLQLNGKIELGLL